PPSPLFPYTTLFRSLLSVTSATGSAERSHMTLVKPCSRGTVAAVIAGKHACLKVGQRCTRRLDREYRRYGFRCGRNGRLTKPPSDRKSTRLNSSHVK